MRIDTTITQNFIGTTGLATVEGYNPEVPSAEYQVNVLEEFVDQLSDVDGKIEVSVQNLDYTDEPGSAKALVGRVNGTDVACVAAPLITEEVSD